MSSQNFDSGDELKFKFAQVVFILSAVASLLLVPFDFYFGEYLLGTVGILFSVQSLISVYFLKNPRLRLIVTNLFLTSCNIILFHSSWELGVYSEIHVFYISCIALPFMMFPLYAKKSLIYSISLPILLLTVSVLNNLDSSTPDGLQKEAMTYYILAVNLINSLLLGFCFYYGYKLNKAAESKIKDQNALLLEAEKMKSLGIMSAGIAHEIRNPLAIIMLQAHSLMGESTSAETKEDLKKIITSSERIVKIIESLRVYSRQNPDDKPVSVNVLENVERAYSLSRDILHDVVLKIKVPPEIHVLSNETELLQILLNLFRNAVYATKDLESPWVQIETQVQDNMVKIICKDSGPGIKKEEINNLFTPFFTTKPVGSGTGLGLSISRKLAESRGGSLYYDPSCENTTFVLELPYYKLS